MYPTEGSKPHPQTLNAIWDEYNEVVLADVTERTAYVYANAWKRRIRDGIGAMPLDAITRLTVKQAWARWDKSASTKNDALAVLSKTLEVAVDAGLIQTNPARALKLKRKDGRSPAARSLSRAELDRFIAFTPEGPYRRIIEALAYTGCRLGEIAALTASDVDLARGLIRIARSLSPNPNGKLIMGDTKSHRERVVPVLPQFRETLETAIQGKEPHQLIFTGPRGGALDSGNLSRSIGLRNWRNEVKIFPPGAPKLHIHDLRHTAATLMCGAGIPVTVVKELLGHSSLAVTQLYARANEAAALAAGDLFGRYLSEFDNVENETQR